MTAAAELPVLEFSRPAGREPAKVDASGTRLRLRALTAMGHSNERIGQALGQPAWLVTRIVNHSARTVTPELRADACRLFDCWWDKRPPERTPAETRAAAAARARARRGRWCPGMALDDDDDRHPRLPDPGRLAPGHRHWASPATTRWAGRCDMTSRRAPSGLAWEPGEVYTLHFVPKLQHAGHYTGWATPGRTPRRLIEHYLGRGKGARITEVQRKADGDWVLVGLEPGTRDRETTLKERGAGPSVRCLQGRARVQGGRADGRGGPQGRRAGIA